MSSSLEKLNIRLIPEWDPQDGILIAWPHVNSDWDYMLEEVINCYVKIASAISSFEKLIVVAPDVAKAKNDLKKIDNENIFFYQVPTNDTWARDFGGISISIDNVPAICDFKFNAWGGKFNWELDNQINRNLLVNGAFACKLIDCKDFVLEGGSIETDGKGILLTTSNCLLTPTRNNEYDKFRIEQYLREKLGIVKILWLDYGALCGDDTDSHIDTLARLTPHDGIIYTTCDCINDEHYDELLKMEEQIKCFTTIDGYPFKLFRLPLPDAIFDENGERLPATYANYLITNEKILVPIYGQSEKDALALSVIAKAFPEYKIEGVDCTALIKQHGSLHCITMQFAQKTLTL